MSRAPGRPAPAAVAPPTVTALWLGGAVLLWALYAAVFFVTRLNPHPLRYAVVNAAANVIPATLLASATYALLKAQVMTRGVPVQIAAHAALGIAFTTTWYALVIVLLAFFEGLAGRGFAISAFSGVAFAWQTFQGLMLYATIAAVCYAVRGGRQADNVTIVNAPPLTRYLTRSGEEMVPVDVRNIVTITGAQDYAEVATLAGGRHLVRMSLADFEQRLDPTRFLRVHRSAIINFDHLASAEPAGGGRLLAHMKNGDAVPVSRAGAQLLREFLV